MGPLINRRAVEKVNACLFLELHLCATLSDVVTFFEISGTTNG